MEEIEYKSGKPATKKVVQGAVTSNFEYVGGEARIKSKVENNGNGVKTNTTYSYREDGTIESEIISDGVKTTKNEYNETGGKVIKSTITEGNIIGWCDCSVAKSENDVSRVGKIYDANGDV